MPNIPNGPVFPSLHASPRRRRRRVALMVVLVLTTLALIWPVYPLFGSARPFILGLPFSLAWVIGWLGVMFVSLGTLYVLEEVRGDADAPEDA